MNPQNIGKAKCICDVLKHIMNGKKKRRERPGLGKWGTTRMASDMAFNLGSPCSPFSPANISFSLSLSVFCFSVLSSLSGVFLTERGQEGGRRETVSFFQKIIYLRCSKHHWRRSQPITPIICTYTPPPFSIAIITFFSFDCFYLSITITTWRVKKFILITNTYTFNFS